MTLNYLSDINLHTQWGRSSKQVRYYSCVVFSFQGRFVVRRLGLAMINQHTKFEVSTISCTEDMKGNARI